MYTRFRPVSRTSHRLQQYNRAQFRGAAAPNLGVLLEVPVILNTVLSKILKESEAAIFIISLII